MSLFLEFFLNALDFLISYKIEGDIREHDVQTHCGEAKYRRLRV